MQSGIFVLLTCDEMLNYTIVLFGEELLHTLIILFSNDGVVMAGFLLIISTHISSGLPDTPLYLSLT